MAARFRQETPNVQVLGRIPFTDMRILFSLADLTLMPSIIPENSPVTIFESHQVGTPVVGSDIGGIPELIDPGRTGYIVPPGDPQALADAIIDHFARPPLERRRMRQACVETVRVQRSLGQHLASLRAVYDEVLAREGTD
jgi:glycosyltransferase involved in cell wall biosynthesis